jgi:protein-S-isoprenylcysteine O-methyltransferase Ste14
VIPFILSFVLWAGLHSVVAAPGVKEFAKEKMGQRAYDGTYRLLYNLFAAVTLLPVLYLLATEVSRSPLWVIPEPFNVLAMLIQLASLLGLTITLWQRDIWDFAGLRQALDYLGNRECPAPSPKLVTSGPHGLVRHPLYFFGLILLWSNPEVTLNIFVFNVLSTLYFWIGSRYEDRRLEAMFGEAYLEYRQRVPGLLPIKLSK